MSKFSRSSILCRKSLKVITVRLPFVTRKQLVPSFCRMVGVIHGLSSFNCHSNHQNHTLRIRYGRTFDCIRK